MPISPPYRYQGMTAQRGVILIMALVLLMMLTILGVSSMHTSSLEERMAGNMRDSEVALEAAEIALNAAQVYVDGIATTVDFSSTGGTGGLFTATAISTTSKEAWQIETNWGGTNTVNVTVPNLANPAEYIIEIIDSDYGQEDDITPFGGYEGGDASKGDISLFKITVRGYGKNLNTRIMLQSTYGKFMS